MTLCRGGIGFSLKSYLSGCAEKEAEQSSRNEERNCAPSAASPVFPLSYWSRRLRSPVVLGTWPERSWSPPAQNSGEFPGAGKRIANVGAGKLCAACPPGDQTRCLNQPLRFEVSGVS